MLNYMTSPEWIIVLINDLIVQYFPFPYPHLRKNKTMNIEGLLYFYVTFNDILLGK